MSGGLLTEVGDAMANYAEHPEGKEICIVYDWLFPLSRHCLYLSGGLLLSSTEFQCAQSYQVGSFFEPASAGSQKFLAKVSIQNSLRAPLRFALVIMI